MSGGLRKRARCCTGTAFYCAERRVRDRGYRVVPQGPAECGVLYYCVDRWAFTHPDQWFWIQLRWLTRTAQVAIIYAGKGVQHHLRRAAAREGHTISIYLPMTWHAAAAFLACAQSTASSSRASPPSRCVPCLDHEGRRGGWEGDCDGVVLWARPSDRRWVCVLYVLVLRFAPSLPALFLVILFPCAPIYRPSSSPSLPIPCSSPPLVRPSTPPSPSRLPDAMHLPIHSLPPLLSLPFPFRSLLLPPSPILLSSLLLYSLLLLLLLPTLLSSLPLPHAPYLVPLANPPLPRNSTATGSRVSLCSRHPGPQSRARSGRTARAISNLDEAVSEADPTARKTYAATDVYTAAYAKPVVRRISLIRRGFEHA
ncbi:hypothetical protein B0H13DRAFT_2458099 [Mycena leptocephala]|nr:hypothetical protein B0H13DRAFT_2458099 [Mycena leptocephala]